LTLILQSRDFIDTVAEVCEQHRVGSIHVKDTGLEKLSQHPIVFQCLEW
jgi:hypothetical protein